MQVCLGVVYAWAVFRNPLEQAFGFTKADSIAPFRYSLLFFTLGMIAGGWWQDRRGPRLVAATGGLLLGLGCLLASIYGDSPTGLILSYGVVGGIGMGFAYVTPVATCVKWFPDRRGLVVGLAIMGFGLGSLFFAPLLEQSLGHDRAQFPQTLSRTFRWLAIFQLVAITGLAQLYRIPSPGWRPAGWNPPAASGSVRVDFSPAQMLREPGFYLMWLIYFLGSAVGLTIIGEAPPLIRTIAGSTAAFSGAVSLGVLAVFNGLGRLGWGAASDHREPLKLLRIMASGLILVCAGWLPRADSFWPLIGGLCAATFCFAGHLTVMPALCARYFGALHIGANYGLLFSAWGLAGFLAPRYFASLLQQGGTYDHVFLTLAGGAVVSLACTFFARPPR